MLFKALGRARKRGLLCLTSASLRSAVGRRLLAALAMGLAPEGLD